MPKDRITQAGLVRDNGNDGDIRLIADHIAVTLLPLPDCDTSPALRPTALIVPFDAYRSAKANSSPRR